MARNQGARPTDLQKDARPFVDLQKDAEEFKTKFFEDIEKCKQLLDAKITALICDPDSLGNAVMGTRPNAAHEFMRAKYDVFISVKSFINGIEKEWITYISEMKKLFLENVELFLAGTKLEVKLPSAEFQSSPGPRKSPGNRKSTASVGSSFYPIISNIAKNIPVLSSPLRRQEVQSKMAEETSDVDDIQFSRRGRLPATSTKLSAAQEKRPFMPQDESSESSENEDKSVFSQRRESEDFRMDTDADLDNLYTSRSGSKSNNLSRKSIKLISSDFNTSQSDSRQKSKFNETTDLNGFLVVPKSLISEDEDIEVENPSQLSSKGRSSRKGRLSSQNNKLQANVVQLENVSNSENQEETGESESVTFSSHIHSKGRARRGKQPVQNIKVNHELQPKSKSGSEDSEEMSAVDQAAESSNINSRKSTRATRSKNAAISKTFEESENSDNGMALKGRKGKQAAKNKKNSAVAPQSKDTTEYFKVPSEEMPTIDTSVDNSKVRRGRTTAAKNNINEFSGKNITTRTPARSLDRKSVIDRVIETAISKSPKKVAFTDEGDITDDLDIYTPVARPTKSAARRKTLLPNLDETETDEMIPTIRTRGRPKRKTICGASDIPSLAPSKRLKVSSKQKGAFMEEDADDDDNLLESDGSYSDWIALKNIDGSVPSLPAIYEVKVWRAKKSAYIGDCESLRHKLTLHKLRQNSGHKHLDKFIERNYGDIQIRYEVMSSVKDAKDEVKNRIQGFIAQHKTTPAYN